MTLSYVTSHALELYRAFRWPTGIICPKCGSRHIYICKDRYKCAHCNHRFSDKSNSLFHSSKLSIPTIMTAIYLVIHHRGISSYSLAEHLGVTQRTSWLLETKIRWALNQHHIQVSGSVSIDETYFGASLKWLPLCKKLALYKKFDIPVENDHPTQPQALMLQRRKGVPVIGLHDRTNLVFHHIKPPVLYSSIQSIIDSHVADVNSIERIVVDSSHLYDPAPYPTERCDHKHHKYQSPHGWSSNNLEGANGLSKRQWRCHYVKPESKYLNGYCNLFVFRYNHRGMDLIDRIRIAFLYFRQAHISISDLTKKGVGV